MQNDFNPYYVAIFTSVRMQDDEVYEDMNDHMFELVENQPGYLGAETFSNDEKRNVTIVKFSTLEQMTNWKNNPEHLEAQKMGIEKWYKHYNVKVCKVEREYEFNREE